MKIEQSSSNCHLSVSNSLNIFNWRKNEQFSKRTGNGINHNLAFTLIEMLVVIAIISILASLSIPSLISANNAAQSISCANNLKQQGVALNLYSGENSGWLLTVLNPAVIPSANLYLGWKTYLAPYVVENYNGSYSEPWIYSGIFKCPSWNYDLKAIYPSDPWAFVYGGGYGWTWQIGYSDADNTYYRRRLQQMKKLSETILIADSLAPVDVSTLCVYYVVNRYPTYNSPSTGFWLPINPLHLGGYNNLWGDLHVSRKDPAFLLNANPTSSWDGNVLSPSNYYYFPKTD